jgi:hypothetical protein
MSAFVGDLSQVLEQVGFALGEVGHHIEHLICSGVTLVSMWCYSGVTVVFKSC